MTSNYVFMNCIPKHCYPPMFFIVTARLSKYFMTTMMMKQHPYSHNSSKEYEDRCNR